jgi:thioesterase domain-containing protein
VPVCLDLIHYFSPCKYETFPQAAAGKLAIAHQPAVPYKGLSYHTGSIYPMGYNPLVKIKDSASDRANPSKQHAPFFCVPGLGGSSFCLYYLANHLSEMGRTVYGFDAPGILPGTQPLRTVEEHAKLYLAAIMRDCPSNSYTLGGYCFGAAVILEMARTLRALDYKVRLVLIDPTAPPAGRNRRETVEQLQALRDLFWAAPSDIPPEYRRVELAAKEALKSYQPQPGAVSALFVGRYDNLLSYDKWYYLTGGRLTEQIMPCHHLQILNEPHVKTLAGWIDEYLTQR